MRRYVRLTAPRYVRQTVQPCFIQTQTISSADHSREAPGSLCTGFDPLAATPIPAESFGGFPDGATDLSRDGA